MADTQSPGKGKGPKKQKKNPAKQQKPKQDSHASHEPTLKDLASWTMKQFKLNEQEHEKLDKKIEQNTKTIKTLANLVDQKLADLGKAKSSKAKSSSKSKSSSKTTKQAPKKKNNTISLAAVRKQKIKELQEKLALAKKKSAK